MSHFAKVVDGIVTKVIVAEQDFINTYNDGSMGSWIQTSYNTKANQHPENKPLRKNFAGIGFTYDATRDAFIPPKPFTSWVLNEDTCTWEAPVTLPDDGKEYIWNENIINWTEVV